MTALQPQGGIRTFFRYIYGHDAFADFSFDLVAPDQGLTEYLSEYLPAERIRILANQPGRLPFIRQVRMLALSGDYDLIHSHGFSAGLLTELAHSALKLPHLMTAHDVFLKAQFNGVAGKLKHLIMSILFQRMTAIHTVTNDARQNLLEFFPGIRPECIHGILHGIDTEYFQQRNPDSIKDKIGLSAEVPLIGFFGRFMGQKGFRLLVDAIELIINGNQVKPLPHVATFGWNGYIREDYEYLDHKGLGNYFHQLEETRDMGGAIKGVDLVAMPSRWEACGLLAMEALSAGVPIVGSDCIGLREVLAGSPAIPFTTNDPSALRQALLSELNELVERKNAFQAYQQVAVKRFNIARPATELVNLYKSLAVAGHS